MGSFASHLLRSYLVSPRTAIYENISEIRNRIKILGPDDGSMDWFWENQKIFLDHELEILKSLDKSKSYVWDNGLDQICFYCERDPRGNKIIPSNIKSLMKIIYQVPKVSIYLDDSLKNIKNKKENDHSRKRNGFNTFINQLYKFHKTWHIKHNAIVVNINEREIDHICEIIKDIFDNLPNKSMHRSRPQ